MKEEGQMKKLLTLFLLITLLVGCTPTGETKTDNTTTKTEQTGGTLSSGTMYSEHLGIDWNYTTYVPEGFDKEEASTLPVLYMLHGAFGNHSDYKNLLDIKTVFDEKIKNKNIDPMVVVFPDGFNLFYIDGPAMDMESAIIEDLIPQVETILNNKPERDSRYIGGLSMGAYGAANFSLKYPELFSKAILMSPAVWEKVEEGYATQDWHVFRDENKNWDDEMWEDHHPTSKFEYYSSKNLPVKFFVISGEADEVTPIDSVKDFVSKLEKVAEVETQYDPEGIHGWVYWEKSTSDSLDKFIGTQDK